MTSSMHFSSGWSRHWSTAWSTTICWISGHASVVQHIENPQFICVRYIAAWLSIYGLSNGRTIRYDTIFNVRWSRRQHTLYRVEPEREKWGKANENGLAQKIYGIEPWTVMGTAAVIPRWPLESRCFAGETCGSTAGMEWPVAGLPRGWNWFPR